MDSSADEYCHKMCEQARELQETDFSKLPYWDYRRIKYEQEAAANRQEWFLYEQAKAYQRRHGGGLYSALEAIGDGGRSGRG